MMEPMRSRAAKTFQGRERRAADDSEDRLAVLRDQHAFDQSVLIRWNQGVASQTNGRAN